MIAMMQNTDRYMIDEMGGYSPNIGRLLSMMEYTRMTTVEAAANLSKEELDYRVDDQGNSIGCLLYHMSCVEEVYQIITFDGRGPNEKEMDRLHLGLNLGEDAHQQIRGNELAYYTDRLHAVREVSFKRFKEKEDDWLDEVSPFGPDHLANNYFRWFHVFEDELNHRGQIRIIRKHLERNQINP